ncbi:hypothetical protein H6G89_12360 [Oscillatoria sp. FACHB-1407]|uniref:hypothetical protein n=1 Tax=Oscillatoria sp. FACHB-1407 TaxID=2692847 RepID=UPI00168793D7|nr:hypothetical protein [Oscillatoria sp. FACHB-1407]MBD2461841.1 hypothetical protein [Oscillatoria sp. FACHB-1407]
MNQSQQELRRAAAKAFMESLDQLGMSLSSPEEEVSEAKPAPASHAKTAPQKPPASASLTVEELEDAVADIEQFIQGIQNQNSEA